jgi:hypothetical protein
MVRHPASQPRQLRAGDAEIFEAGEFFPGSAYSIGPETAAALDLSNAMLLNE